MRISELTLFQIRELKTYFPQYELNLLSAQNRAYCFNENIELEILETHDRIEAWLNKLTNLLIQQHKKHQFITQQQIDRKVRTRIRNKLIRQTGRKHLKNHEI